MPKSKPPRKRRPGKNQARPLRARGFLETRFGTRAKRVVSGHEPYGLGTYDTQRVKGGALSYLFSLYLPVLIARGFARGVRAAWWWLKGY